MTIDASTQFTGATVISDLFNLVCTNRIGWGSSRDVYESDLMPDVVFKFDLDKKSFSNVLEWQAWNAVKDCPDRSKWFAPCVAISDCGTVLVMKRTKPALHFPAQVPRFFHDLKPGNFGTYEGRFVCHDYGTFFHLETSTELERAEWKHQPILSSDTFVELQRNEEPRSSIPVEHKDSRFARFLDKVDNADAPGNCLDGGDLNNPVDTLLDVDCGAGVY